MQSCYASLEVLKEERLAENAHAMGEYFRQELIKLNSPYIKEVRGKGLLNAIEIKHDDEDAAWKLCIALKENGLLAKPTHGDKIRFAPPLIISKEELNDCLNITAASLAYWIKSYHLLKILKAKCLLHFQLIELFLPCRLAVCVFLFLFFAEIQLKTDGKYRKGLQACRFCH